MKDDLMNRLAWNLNGVGVIWAGNIDPSLGVLRRYGFEGQRENWIFISYDFENNTVRVDTISVRNTYIHT